MTIRRRNIKEDHRDLYTIRDYQLNNFASKVIGIIPVASKLISVKEAHGNPGNDAGAVTLSVERLRNSETSGQGNIVVNATINLKGTANTVQSGTIIENTDVPPHLAAGFNYFDAGDRVGLILTGANTNVGYVNTVLTFRPVDDAIPLSHSVSSSASSSKSSSVSSSSSSSVSVSSSKSSSVSSSASISASVSSSASSSASISASVSSSASSSASISSSKSSSVSSSASISASVSSSASASKSSSVSSSISSSASSSPSI